MSAFGYLALATVGEVVADRLVKACFLDGTVQNTDAHSVPPGLIGNLSATFHTLMSNPTVDFSTGTRDRVEIGLDVYAVLELSQPNPIIAAGDWLKTRVSVRTPLSVKGESLSARLDAVTAGDVSLESLQSNNPALQLAAAVSLPDEIAKSLNRPQFNQLKIDLGLDPEILSSNAIDAAVLDDATPADRDALAVGFYQTADPQHTRGAADGIQLSLGAGKSITLCISKTLFDALMTAELNSQFMRYDVRLGQMSAALSSGPPSSYDPGPDQARRKIFWGKSLTLSQTSLAAYWIRVLPKPERADLGDCTVTNLRTGETRSFYTTAQGEGVWIRPDTLSGPIYGPYTIPMDDLQQGDILRFSGAYKQRNGVKLHYPAVELGNGFLTVKADAVTDIRCYHGVTVHMKGDVRLAVDPATGQIIVTADQPDIDLPWYVDVGVSMLAGLMYFFAATGAGASGFPWMPRIASLFEMPGGIVSQVEKEVSDKAGVLTPGVAGDNHRTRLFWEDLELKADSLVLHGQMEAGWLYSGGRTRGLGVALDETEFSAANGMASADLRNMSDPSLSDVRGIAVVKSKSFEELGPEELAKLSYQTPPVSIPAAAKLPGVILGVRTAYSRYAKVRVDQSHDKALYLRWITYDRQPDPFGEIVGQLAEQHGTEPEDTKAWGTFSAKVHGLYSAYGLKTSWTYDGPGQVHFTGASIQITIDFATDLPPSVDFNPALQAYGIGKVLTAEGRLKVTVVDIFGRSVSAEKTISCTSSKDGAGGMDVLMPPLASQWELKKWLLSPDPVATQLRTEIATQELLKFLK